MEDQRRNRRKILAGLVLLLVLAIVLGVSGFLRQRELDRETGYAHGYTTGYSIGYTDHLHKTAHNGVKTAGEIVPYEPGSGKWKYFIMGFDAGYTDGLSGEMVWDIDAS